MKTRVLIAPWLILIGVSSTCAQSPIDGLTQTSTWTPIPAAKAPGVNLPIAAAASANSWTPLATTKAIGTNAPIEAVAGTSSWTPLSTPKAPGANSSIRDAADSPVTAADDKQSPVRVQSSLDGAADTPDPQATPTKVDSGARPQPDGETSVWPSFTRDWLRSALAANGTRFNKDTSFWATGEYLVSWIHSASLPPLVTTSPAGTPQTSAGVLGAPGTTTLFGGGTANGDSRAGMRLGVGYWFDSQQLMGIEAGFMLIENQATLYSAASNGSTILARPYTDATTGLHQAVLTAFPGSSSGSVFARANSGNFDTGNIDLTNNVYDTGWFRLNALGGYRFYGYGESLAVQQTIAPTGGNFVPGTSIVSADHFGTSNTFHGMDMGLRSEFFWWNSLSVELLTKVSLGNLRTVVSINGDQTTTVPGTAPVVHTGGVYALRSNFGSFANNYFGVFPEFGAALKWQVRPYLQLRMGYSFFLLEGVARAGNQVATTISPANFAPSTATGGQPSFTLDRSNIWLQTLNFGLTYTY